MGFTYKSSNVQAPDLYDPIDDNILLQGQKAIYDRTMAFAEEANKYKSAFFGQNAYGKDAEILKQKEAEYNAAISEVTKGGIESMEAQTAINAIINQASSDKDILGISQRTSAYERELKNKQEAEAKGETYVSPLLRQADKYYNSGKYYADERFNKTGFVAPTDKELDEIAKNTPEWENWVTTGGYDINQKGKAVGTLQANYLTHFQNNPKWSQFLDDKFEQETEGLDLGAVAQQGFAAIQQMFPYLPPQQQQQAYADLQEGLQIQQQNPYAEGAWKQKLRDDYFSNQAYMAAQAKTYVNTTDKKANEYSKIAVQHQNAKELVELREKSAIAKVQEQARLKALAGNISDPLQRKLIEMGIEKGLTTELLNEDGTTFKSSPELVAMGLKAEENKEEDKTKIKIGSNDYTKAEIIENINIGSQDFIKDYIKTFFGDTVKSIEVNGEDIIYEHEGWGSVGWDKKIKKSDLLKKIEENSKIDAGI